MKSLRHVVKVMRPTKNEGSLGELQGNPEVICNQWPCSIDALSGNEQERARQNGVTATYKIEGYGNPDKPFKETDWLELGERKFNIANIEDVQLNGVKLKLLCGETKQ